MIYGSVNLIVSSPVPNNTDFILPGGLTSQISIVLQGSNYVMQCIGQLNATDYATLTGLNPPPPAPFLNAINDIYNQCQTILKNEAVLTAIVPGIAFVLPAGLKGTYSYVSENGVTYLQSTGLMSTADYTILTGLTPPAPYLNAINSIYNQPGAFVQNTFAAVFGNPGTLFGLGLGLGAVGDAVALVKLKSDLTSDLGAAETLLQNGLNDGGGDGPS